MGHKRVKISEKSENFFNFLSYVINLEQITYKKNLFVIVSVIMKGPLLPLTLMADSSF